MSAAVRNPQSIIGALLGMLGVFVPRFEGRHHEQGKNKSEETAKVVSRASALARSGAGVEHVDL